MSYVLNTPADRQAMLQAIGAASPEELFHAIPEHLRLQRLLDVPAALTEMELEQHLAALAARNAGADRAVCFLGGGSYDHFIPAVVDAVAGAQRILHGLHAVPGRGQPGELAGVLRVSDAHLPAHRAGRRQRQPLRRRQRRCRGRAHGADRSTRSARKVLVAESVHPEYRQALATYLANLRVRIRDAAGAGRLTSIPTTCTRRSTTRRCASSCSIRISSAAWKKSRR